MSTSSTTSVKDKCEKYVQFCADKFTEHGDQKRAAGSKKYMKDLFEFYGISTKDTKTVFKDELYPRLEKDFSCLEDKISASFLLFQQKFVSFSFEAPKNLKCFQTF